MSGQDDQSDKSFDPTPQKLQKAREKGEIAKSTDLSVAASYVGMLLAASGFGAVSMLQIGQTLAVFLDQPDRIGRSFFVSDEAPQLFPYVSGVIGPIAPWLVIPMAAVLLSILAQRAFVVTPSKLKPKMSRVSIMSNAKQKFGRSGLFEFSKSFAKLIIYSICLAWLISARLPELLASSASPFQTGLMLLGHIFIEFLLLAVVVSGAIGIVDALWQQFEHRRKNMMTRKEVMDETKEAEGDPHMKQQRRQKGQEIAARQMMADVPGADVVIVNPTHYAVVLKWDRTPNSAPQCVAKGVDEIAARIREIAAESGVPIHSDPPTARLLYAEIDLGMEIAEEHYQAVAAAIRFADQIRQRAKGQV